MTRPRPTFPFPPRAMPIDMAAYYVGGLSEGTAKKQFEEFSIHPVPISKGRLAYLKEDLDRFLEGKAGKAMNAVKDDWLDTINGTA